MKKQNYTTFFKVLAKDFDISEATGNNEIALVLGLFAVVRTATGNNSLKLSNEDYNLCNRFAFRARIKEFSEFDEFGTFLTDELVPELLVKIHLVLIDN